MLTMLQIGGSNAGLMHGIMLKHHGYNVTILEQDVSPIRQGYDAGVKEGPDLLAFLDRHDRIKRPYSVSCISPKTINQDGKVQSQSGKPMITTSWGLLISILRANYDRVPSKAISEINVEREGDGKVEFKNGAQVTDVKDAELKVHIQYKDIESGAARSLTADIAVVADGSNSSMRGILMPGVKRQYAGYMCWRGTVREDLIDKKWNALYSERMSLHFMNRNYLLLYVLNISQVHKSELTECSYTIPTDNGDLEQGKRLHNWLWYINLSEDSEDHAEAMTDFNGKVHHGTVPRGLVQPELWVKQKAIASSMMPEGIAAIVQKTETPFVTKIYDVASTNAVFFGGKLFVVGDALMTLRPNVGLSTSQAAYHCGLLEKVLEKKMTPEQWNRAVLKYGNAQRRFAIAVSSYGLGTKVDLVWNACSWLFLLLGQKLGIAS